MTSSYVLARRTAGMFDPAPSGERYKFVADSARLIAGLALDDDEGLVHEDLIADLGEDRVAAAGRESLTLGWVWVNEPNAVYELAYDSAADIEPLLRTWLAAGRPTVASGP